MKRINADECIKWIKEKKGITLYPYQEVMIRSFCNDEEVLCARGIGRSFVAKLFGAYVAYKYDRNDTTISPDVIIPWTEALRCGVIPDALVASFDGKVAF